MIAQRYRTIRSVPCPSINRCLEITTINKTEPIIITGGNDQKAYIYNRELELMQEIPFDGWVRCAITFDIDNDDNNEFAIGSGDNSLRIFKLGENSKFAELWRFDFDKNVSAVAAGDINGDGRIEIVAGSWDHTLRVFDGLTGSYLWTLEFPEWVTYLKVLDANWDGFQEIIVGLKSGGFGVINGFTGECIWEYQFEKKVNDCDLVFLANNEFPHLMAGGDDQKLYIFDYHGNLKSKIDVEDRILSIDKGDINGDCYNEIVMGLGDNKLLVLESIFDENQKDETQENVDLKVRWKAKLPNAATGIKVYDIIGDGVPRIVITGYFQELKILEDFYYGKEPVKSTICSYIKRLPSPDNYYNTIKEVLNEECDAELINKNGIFFFPKTIQKLDDLLNPITTPQKINIIDEAAEVIPNNYNFMEVVAVNLQMDEIESMYERVKQAIGINKLDDVDRLSMMIIKSIEKEVEEKPQELISLPTEAQVTEATESKKMTEFDIELSETSKKTTAKKTSKKTTAKKTSKKTTAEKTSKKTTAKKTSKKTTAEKTSKKTTAEKTSKKTTAKKTSKKTTAKKTSKKTTTKKTTSEL